MKIAHITLHYDLKTGIGIINNCRQKSLAFKEVGIHDVDVILLNYSSNQFDKDIVFINAKDKNIFQSSKNRLFNKYNLINNSINLDKYDKIIIRYPLSDRTFWKITQDRDVFFEIHGILNVELKNYYQNNLFNNPLLTVSSLIRYQLEQKYGTKCLNSSKGIIGLTTDIIDNLAANFVVTPKKVITNGVSEKSYAFTKFKPFDGNNLELIFSGSSYLEWHGLERLTDSLNKLRTHIKINLNIVGTFPTNKLRSTNANFNIIYHGLLDCKKSEKIFRNCNLAIGTLALYTKGMQEASPLKSREYFCRGIPFIKAYYDTDIDKYAEMKQFCLDFPDNNSEIDFNQVIEFIKDMSSQTYDVALRMRELAIEKLNWTIKVKEYFDFLEI